MKEKKKHERTRVCARFSSFDLQLNSVIKGVHHYTTEVLFIDTVVLCETTFWTKQPRKHDKKEHTHTHERISFVEIKRLCWIMITKHLMGTDTQKKHRIRGWFIDFSGIFDFAHS